jgi:pimeloyl-ACP methyl ester carboxylesterase
MTPSVTACSIRKLLACLSLMALSAVLLVALAGCEGAATQPALTTATSASEAGATPAYSSVTFGTDDGLTLGGRIYGEGARGVILAHMYPADQTSWDAVAQRLAAEGFIVLTFDFRGYGESEGTKDIRYLDLDVTAAVATIRQAGAEEIVLVGASMGGTACLKSADQLQALSSIRLAGVATLSAPVQFKGLSAQAAMPRLQIPLLFIAAEGDSGASAARDLQDLAEGRGTLEILAGSDHGTDLFAGSQAQETWRLLLQFLQESMPATI